MERQVTLNLITNKISKEDNLPMMVEPEEEIDRLIKDLPKEKSFGIDGSGDNKNSP